MNPFSFALNDTNLRGQVNATGDRVAFAAVLLLAEALDSDPYTPVTGETPYDEVITRLTALGLPPHFIRQLDTLAFAERRSFHSRNQ